MSAIEDNLRSAHLITYPQDRGRRQFSSFARKQDIATGPLPITEARIRPYPGHPILPSITRHLPKTEALADVQGIRKVYPYDANEAYSAWSPVTSPLEWDAQTRPATAPLISNYSPYPQTKQDKAEIQTGKLPLLNIARALRQPVVIRGRGHSNSRISIKRRGLTRPAHGRRWVIHIAMIAVLICIAIGSLIVVIPVGNESKSAFNPFQPIFNWAQGSASNTNNLVEQAVPITGIPKDGYEPGNHFAPGSSLPAGNGNFDGFTYGQCTFWADYRYHQLTGHWVPWGGDAYLWSSGARASGWVVSSTPHVPSIIILQRGVQGASWYGHVAVVESMANGVVHTSNWNWAGHWNNTTYVDFSPGPGVSFAWYPEA